VKEAVERRFMSGAEEEAKSALPAVHPNVFRERLEGQSEWG